MASYLKKKIQIFFERILIEIFIAKSLLIFTVKIVLKCKHDGILKFICAFVILNFGFE